MAWGANTLKPTPSPAVNNPAQVAPHLTVSTQATPSENNQVSTGEKTGLANSRWAVDSSGNLPTQMASTSTSLTLTTSTNAEFSTHNTTSTDPLAQHPSKDQTPLDNKCDPASPPLREQLTKITKNSEKTMIGKARIFNYTRADQLLTLQLEQQGITVLTEEVSDEAAWIMSARSLAIIYQASKDSSKWTIQFQFPGFAQRFYDVILVPRKARGIPIQTLNPFKNSLISPENGASPPKISAPGPAAQHTYSSPSRNVSSYYEAQYTPSALSRNASSNHENDTRASIGTHHDDMNEVGGIENLIDVRDTPHVLEEMRTLEFLNKLTENMGEDFLVLALSELTEQGGNVLKQISNIVVLGNGSPATSLSANDILASSQYVEASSKLLGAWLDGSSMFKEFPDVWTLRFVEDKAPRILKRAVDERSALESTRVVAESEKQDEKIVGSENAQVNNQHLSDRTLTSTNENQKLSESESKAMTDQSVSPRTHVIGHKSYLIDDLLCFRDNGIGPQIDTLSKDILHLFPSGAASKEKPLIKTTRTGVPIAGGLSEPISTSGVAIHPFTRDSQQLMTRPVENHERAEGESNLDAHVWNTPSTEIAEPVVTKEEIVFLPDIASKASKEPSVLVLRKIVPELIQTDEKKDAHVEVQEIITQEPFIENSTSKDNFTTPSKDVTDTSSANKVTHSQGLSRGRHVPTNSEWERLTVTFSELSVETHKSETATVPRANATSHKENYSGPAEAQPAVDGSKDSVNTIAENAVPALPISLKVESSSKEIKTTTSAEHTHLIGARDLPKSSPSNPRVGLSGSRWANPGVLPAPVARSSSGTPVRPTAPEFRPNPISPVQYSAPTPNGHHRSITSVSAQENSVNRPYSDESVPELKKGVHNSKWANVEVPITSSSRTSYSPVVSASTALTHSHMAQTEVLASYATVLDIDLNTGLSRPVTGPVIRIGTVSMKAMVPTQGSLASQENANWQFLAHSNMHHHHSSSGSSMKSPKGTGSTYEPLGVSDFAASSQPRSALSPIRQDKNAAQVQARAQARLNASLSERSDIAVNHNPWY